MAHPTSTSGTCRSCFSFVLFVLGTVILHSQATAPSVSITDFRIPTSQYQRLTGGLNGYWNRGNQDNGGTVASSYTNTNSDFSNSVNYVLGEFSEQRSLQVSASLVSDWTSSKNTSDNPSSMYRANRSSYSASVYPNLLVDYSPYISPDTWFWNVNATGNAQYGYSHTSEGQTSPGLDTSYTYFSRNQNYQYSLVAGIGYGRQRDGEPVFEALRVLDKLAEDSALVRPLSEEEVLSLVDILARRTEYSVSQDRYDKFIMEDVFKRLEAMGVLKGGAGSAFDVMRAFEVLQYERIEPRLFGWRVTAGIMRSAQQNQNTNQGGGSIMKNVMDYLRLSADYGWPLSVNTNLNASASVMVPREDQKRRIAMSFHGAASHQVSDRIDTRLEYSFLRSSTSLYAIASGGFQREVDHQLTWGFTFFIENDVMLNANAGYQYAHVDLFDPGVYPFSNTYSSYIASFGITYRFL